jgi:hypothetical protein
MLMSVSRRPAPCVQGAQGTEILAGLLAELLAERGQDRDAAATRNGCAAIAVTWGSKSASSSRASSGRLSYTTCPPVVADHYQPE